MNVGKNRWGLAPGPAGADLADEIARLPGLQLRGFQGYHGSLQQMVDLDRSAAEIRRALDLLLESAQVARSRGYAFDVLTRPGTGSRSTDLGSPSPTALSRRRHVSVACPYLSVHYYPTA